MKTPQQLARLLPLTLFVMAVSVPASVFAQDNDEVFLEITVLEDGDSVTGEFLENVTAQLYAFSASKGDRITISMTQITEGLDPYMVLLGSRGEVLIDDDDGGELQLSASIRNFLIPEDSSYYLLATDFKYLDNIFLEAEQYELPEAPLEYTLSISGIQPATANPQHVEIFRGTLTFGVEARGGSSPTEPVFYYGFVGTEGQTIDLAMQSEEFDSALHLFAPGGDRIAVSDDEIPQSRMPNAALHNITLPADGLYIVFATDVFFYNAGKNQQSGSFVGGRFIINLDESVSLE